MATKKKTTSNSPQKKKGKKYYSPKERYNYHLDNCQYGYNDKLVYYSAGYCDGYCDDYPNDHNDCWLLSGKRRGLYSLGYYNGFCARHPQYRKQSRKKK